MGEINKIGSNPFDVKITQLGPDQRFKRETAITDEEQKRDSSPQQQQTSTPQSQAQNQENPGMAGMLEALRKRQEEQNTNEYIDRRASQQRERNRQASEDYIRNVNEVREELAEKADEMLEDTKGYNKVYTSRLQDISQKHVEKLLKHDSKNKLVEKAKILKQEGQKEQDQKQPELSSAKAKIRPELSKLLNERSEKQNEKLSAKAQETDEAQSHRKLLDNAVNKLRMKLGGAHINPSKGIPGELNPILQQAGADYPLGPKREAGVFRPDLEQVEHSIAHSRALKNEEGNRYIPLEEADVQKLMYENKLPLHQSMVQSLLLASHRLRDSSHHFQKAAVLIATAGLMPETNLMQVVTDALRTYEKYLRPSILRKLLHYIMGQKIQQMNQGQKSLNTPLIETPLSEDDPLLLQTQFVPNFKGGKGKLATGLPAQQAPLPSNPDRSKSPLYKAMAREEVKILTPEEIAKAYDEAPDIHPLHEEVTQLLKKFGLPASKLMVQQLVQSAQGNPLKAQAMALQLAQGKALQPQALESLEQALIQLTPEERALPPEALFERLGLEINDKLRTRLTDLDSQENQPEQLSRAQNQKWLELLKGPLSAFRPHLEKASIPAKESILLLQSLAERTETLNSLMPRLQQAFRLQPSQALEMAEKIRSGLKTAVDTLQIPTDRSLKAESKMQLTQAYAKVLKTGSDLQLMPELIQRLQWQRPVTLSVEGMQPEDWQLPETQLTTPLPQNQDVQKSENTLFDALLAKLPENTVKMLEKMPMARNALQQILTLAEKTGLNEPLLKQLEKRFNQTDVLPLLQRAEHLSPLLKQSLSQWAPPAGQVLSQESQQQLLHVIGQQLDKGGQAYLLPRVMADLRWMAPEKMSKSLPSLQATPLANSAPQTAKAQASEPVTQKTNLVSASKTSSHPALPKLEQPNQPFHPTLWVDQCLENVSLISPQQKQITRESLLLLAQLSERTETLEKLLPKVSQLIQTQPQLTVLQLEKIQPALQTALEQYLAAGAQPLAQNNQKAFVEVITGYLQTRPLGMESVSQNPLESLWSRFYSGEMPGKLQNVLEEPEARQGFMDLHRLIQDFELSSYSQQSALKTWQACLPELAQRLSQLPQILQPTLEHLNNYPQQQWLVSGTLQNRITQALQQFLTTGQAEALQTVLVRFMTENPHQRDPLPLVAERLRQWGLNAEPALSQHLWQLAGGSKDRLDALALLNQNHLPLVPENTELVLSFLKGIPPQNRFQSASQILSFLSPRLITLIDQKLRAENAQAPSPELKNESGNRLPILSQFLAQPLPGSLNKIQATLQSMPNPFLVFDELEQAISQLSVLFTQTPKAQNIHQWLLLFKTQIQELQTLLKQFPMQIPLLPNTLDPMRDLLMKMQSAFLELENTFDAEGILLPRTGDWLGRLPAQLKQILTSLVQNQALPSDASLLSRAFIQKMNPFALEMSKFSQNLAETQNSLEIYRQQRAPQTDLESLHLDLQNFTQSLVQAQAKPGKEQALQTIRQFIRQLSSPINHSDSIMKAFLELEAELKPLLQAPPELGTWSSRLPVQIMSLLSQLLAPEEVPQLLAQTQQVLPRMMLLLKQLPETQSNTPIAEQTLFLPQELPESALQEINKIQEMPQDLVALQNYLKALGIPMHQNDNLQQILDLAQGSRERLDTIAMLLRSQMPLLPAHIQIMAEYVRLLPPQERFKSISQILLYLSDTLIEKMKAELKQKGKPAHLNSLAQGQGWELDEEAEATGSKLLKQFPGEVSKDTLESMRYLLKSPLPKTPQNLEKLQTLMHMPFQPQRLLQPAQEPLAHLLSLLQVTLPAEAAYTLAAKNFIQAVLNYFQNLQTILSPAQQAQLGPWLMSLTQALEEEEQAFIKRLEKLESELQAEGGEKTHQKEGWLGRILRQVNGIAQRIEKQAPDQQEEVKRILQRFQQEARHLQAQLSGLQTYLSAEAVQSQISGPAQSLEPQPLLMIPAYIQSLGYPVEICLQENPKEKESGSGKSGGSQIQLSVKTHTLGTLIFQISTQGKALHLRLGVEKKSTQAWIQPYLEALPQKLSDLPWEIQSLQTYLIAPEYQGHNLIARQMRTKYRQGAIDAL